MVASNDSIRQMSAIITRYVKKKSELESLASELRGITGNKSVRDTCLLLAQDLEAQARVFR